MKRRNFIKSGSALSIPFFIKGIPVSAVSRSSLFSSISNENDRILVLIQMNGGNDGLNMITPIDQYDKLMNARSNILVPENQIIKLSDELGMHPAMSGLQSVWDDARMTVVQNVGYPDQNRSHFRSTDIWTSGSPANETWNTGWLGRNFDKNYGDYPVGYPNGENPDPFALSIGSTVSQTCQGPVANFSLAINDPFNLTALSQGGSDEVPDSPYGDELTFLRTAIEQTNAYADVITNAADSGNSLSTLYDENSDLAQKLKTVAYLISGGLQTKVYVVNLGGFDTHANQVVEGNASTGVHGNLLQNLSDAIRAFQDDLKLLGIEEKVIGMTFSEFGRQIKSNNSLGTDHGNAAPMVIFGSCVKAGIVGENTQIPEQVEIQQGVQMQFDFRSVYSSILMDWFEVPEQDIRDMLYEDFTYIPLVEACLETSISDEKELVNISLSLNPNPCATHCLMSFESRSEWLRVSLFDALGQEVKVISAKQFDAGKHNLKMETRALQAGNYYVRIISHRSQVSRGLVKI